MTGRMHRVQQECERCTGSFLYQHVDQECHAQAMALEDKWWTSYRAVASMLTSIIHM